MCVTNYCRNRHGKALAEHCWLEPWGGSLTYGDRSFWKDLITPMQTHRGLLFPSVAITETNKTLFPISLSIHLSPLHSYVSISLSPYYYVRCEQNTNHYSSLSASLQHFCNYMPYLLDTQAECILSRPWGSHRETYYQSKFTLSPRAKQTWMEDGWIMH